MVLLEPLHIQLPDLRGADAESLAQRLVGDVGGAWLSGDDRTEPELDDVVDLLLRELLHVLSL